MNINRQNYEEYFLLYVDNELQPQERIEVEDFAAQHPDLSDELKMLKAAILPENALSFTNKEALYKKETGINITNAEQYFLLYVDNELSATQRTEVETFVLQHPAFQENFTQLKQSILAPQSIVFKGKNSLYKSEKERRLVPVFWMRMGVAAALLACIALTWTLTQGNEEIKPAIAGNSAPANMQTGAGDTASQPKAANNNPTVAEANQEINNQIEKKSASEKTVRVSTQKSLAKSMLPKLKEEKKDNDLGTATASTQLIQQPAVQPLAMQQNNRQPEERLSENGIITTVKNPDHQEESAQPMLASNTVYREVDTNDDDRNLYIGSATINKNKLKGFFKKAVVFLEKKTLNSD